MPVMEGKSALFQQLATVNVIPLCLKTQSSEELLTIIKSLSQNFSGINLEDIKAPECFEIEEDLKKNLDIPIFHDD